MSTTIDLVKRLRTMAKTGWNPIGDEAAAEIDRLRARVESLEESLHYCNGVADLAMKHRDVAEKCVAELEQDAKRYRWLRNESWGGPYISGKFPRVAEKIVIVDPYVKCTVLAEKALDDAIDAALAKDGA